jgi:hypothetical protein
MSWASEATTALITCGLTQSITTSAPRTQAALSAAAATPRRAAVRSARSRRRPESTMSWAATEPPATRPRMRASAMFPAPTKAKRRPLSMCLSDQGTPGGPRRRDDFSGGGGGAEGVVVPRAWRWRRAAWSLRRGGAWCDCRCARPERGAGPRSGRLVLRGPPTWGPLRRVWGAPPRAQTHATDGAASRSVRATRRRPESPPPGRS